MTTKTYAKMTIENTAKEIDAFGSVKEMLRQIESELPENAILVNDETGDVVMVDELARVRGILDFFMRTSEVSLAFK